MPEKETASAPMDAAKKKKLGIIAGIGVIVIGYFYFKNKSSSTTAASTPTVVPFTGSTGSAGSGYNSTVGQLNPIPVMGATYNTNSGNTTNNAWNTSTSTTNNNQVSTSNVSSSITNPAPKGKVSINTPVVKRGTTISGGNTRIAGTTATAKPTHPVFHGTPTQVQAANQRYASNQAAANQRNASNQAAANQRKINNQRVATTPKPFGL